MPCSVFVCRLIQADHPLTAGFKEIIFFLRLLSLNFCQLISVVILDSIGYNSTVLIIVHRGNLEKGGRPGIPPAQDIGKHPMRIPAVSLMNLLGRRRSLLFV